MLKMLPKNRQKSHRVAVTIELRLAPPPVVLSGACDIARVDYNTKTQILIAVFQRKNVDGNRNQLKWLFTTIYRILL